MKGFSSTRSRYYPDLPLFMVLIPIIAAINYYLTYTDIRFNGFLLLTYSIDTVQGYAAWLVVRAIVIRLDTRLPYAGQMVRRIIIQFLLTTLAGLLVISLLTELVSLIAKGRAAPLNFYTFDLFIIGIWFFFLNGIYIGLHFYGLYRTSEEARKEELRLQAGGVMARVGKQDVLLPFEEITGLFVDGDYVATVNREGRRYYLDQSLDKLEKTLPSTRFFRLNRQYIVHRQLVTGFERAENGKINVLIKSGAGVPPQVTVSRTKAPSFKEWFRPE